MRHEDGSLVVLGAGVRGEGGGLRGGCSQTVRGRRGREAREGEWSSQLVLAEGAEGSCREDVLVERTEGSCLVLHEAVLVERTECSKLLLPNIL